MMSVPRYDHVGRQYARTRRPEAYLDPQIRSGMSLFTQTTDPAVAKQLSVLRDDLRSGEWHRRNAPLLNRTTIDLGYRLVVAEL